LQLLAVLIAAFALEDEMVMRVRENKTASRFGWLLRTGLPVLRRFCAPALLLALGLSPLLERPAFSALHGFRQTAHPAPHAPAPAPQNHSMPEIRSGVQPKPPAGRPASKPTPNPGANPGAKPGQQHLPEWWNNHRNLTPEQQADALRREPGFHNLPADQQQRLIDRLHSLDQKTPQQQQRIMQRNEAFERLSPERQQEVRGAAQALRQMSPEREQVVRHAFQQLRNMPPAQREQLLNSKVYGGQFSPQERTVLGNLLSIEPYQPGGIAQPYFGRP
jgi:Protein of unknown function (DUF3106)